MNQQPAWDFLFSQYRFGFQTSFHFIHGLTLMLVLFQTAHKSLPVVRANFQGAAKLNLWGQTQLGLSGFLRNETFTQWLNVFLKSSNTDVVPSKLNG